MAASLWMGDVSVRPGPRGFVSGAGGGEAVGGKRPGGGGGAGGTDRLIPSLTGTRTMTDTLPPTDRQTSSH